MMTGNDDDKLVVGKEVCDGMQNGNKSSCGRTRWTKGKLISKRKERGRVKKCWVYIISDNNTFNDAG